MHPMHSHALCTHAPFSLTSSSPILPSLSMSSFALSPGNRIGKYCVTATMTKLTWAVLLAVSAAACSTSEVTPTPASAHAKGPCVLMAPPTVTELRSLAEYGINQGAVRRAAVPDLDGDGQREGWVTAGNLRSASGNDAFALYLDKGKCGVLVGAFWADQPPRQAGTGPMADIIVHASHAGDELETRYCFSGTRYVVAAERELRAYDRAGKLRHVRNVSDWSVWRHRRQCH